ncbi:hypothetical protein B1690_00705 [Geobacillus sp. 46C-IIa]|nr:hypothetical protein B1690_00705 [Geobacillus sp. 46C-IIa]
MRSNGNATGLKRGLHPVAFYIEMAVSEQRLAEEGRFSFVYVPTKADDRPFLVQIPILFSAVVSYRYGKEKREMGSK